VGNCTDVFLGKLLETHPVQNAQRATVMKRIRSSMAKCTNGFLCVEPGLACHLPRLNQTNGVQLQHMKLLYRSCLFGLASFVNGLPSNTDIVARLTSALLASSAGTLSGLLKKWCSSVCCGFPWSILLFPRDVSLYPQYEFLNHRDT
jgi:hypothetical protein